MPVTRIEWTATTTADGTVLPGYTFNPWVGCTKVSPACDHCYAEGWATRTGQSHLWSGDRRRTSESNWYQPVKWDREAAAAAVRRRVFCASLADVFDNQVPTRWREDLWHRIAQTPHLDWLLLTKRPQNIAKMLPDPATGVKPWGCGWRNVWLGTTTENQEEADRRIPHLLSVPAAVHFLSCEPLLGFLRLPAQDAYWQPIDWVICGGESGPGARPMHPAWATSLRDQCADADIPFFFKQWGDWAPHTPAPGGNLGGDLGAERVRIVHPTGQTNVEVFLATGGLSTIPGSRFMARVGKKSAGATLRGCEWRQFPCVATENVAGVSEPENARRERAARRAGNESA